MMTGGGPSARTLLELMLLQSAARFDLRQQADRRRSVRFLERLFLSLQPHLRPDLAIELGAYEASFSQAMAAQGIPAVALEANPHNAERFGPSIAATGLPIEYHNEAISDHTGVETFRIKTARGSQQIGKVNSSHSLLDIAQPGFAYESVSVPAVTFDDLVQRPGIAGRTYSAWIDIEGALGKLFAGSETAFDTCLSVLIEVEDREIWNGQMLAPDVIDALMARGMVPVARDFFRGNQYNIVFLREEAFDLPGVRAALADHLRRVAPLPPSAVPVASPAQTQD